MAPFICVFQNCSQIFHSTRALRNHRYQKHSAPVPFIIDGTAYIISKVDSTYQCPLPDCTYRPVQRSEDIYQHIVSAHNHNAHIDVFGPKDPVPQHISSSHQILVPSTSPAAPPSPHTISQANPPSESIPRQGHVAILSDVDYLLSHPIFDSVGVCMHTALQILVCQSCKAALTSNMVAGHLKNQHAIKLDDSTLHQFRNLCIDFNIYPLPEQVLLPSPCGPPIQFIAPPVNGFACTADYGCHYAVKDLHTMQRHYREKHGHLPLIEGRHRPCQVQRLFTGIGNSYFEIDSDLHGSNAPQDLRASLKQMVLAFQSPVIPPPNTERERTPLIRCMDWDTFLPNIRMDPTRRHAAHLLAQKHTSEEYDGIFTHLVDAIRLHFDKAATILNGLSSKMSYAQTLIHGATIPREGAKYWKPIGRENTNYPAFMLQLTRSLIRIHLKFQHQLLSEFSFALSPYQTCCLEHLIAALQGLTATPYQRMVAYHNLMWSLVIAGPEQCETQWGNPIQRAIWLKALRQDGNFYEATDLTPDLAKLKYLCNMTSLLEALMNKDVDMSDVPQDGLRKLAIIHEQALSLGRPTTFNMLYDMQKFASSIAYSQVKEPNVYVSPDFGSITIGVHTMELESLRNGIKELLNDVEKRYATLTKGNRTVKAMPDNLIDDLTDTTRGYSFLSEEPFNQNAHSLFYCLVEEYSLAMVDNDGRIGWNIPQIKEFLRDSLHTWEPLYHLLFITTHISSRGTQFIDHQITNADRHRNLFAQLGEMFLLTTYSKTTSATDHDSCTPGFLPNQVAYWLLEFLGGGLRNAESILAGIAYGKDVEQIYRTYLCVGDGARIAADKFAAKLPHWNDRYFKCRWGLRDFRQGAITMAREFISPTEIYDQADVTLSESADHSIGVDHEHYAVVRGAIPRLTNSTIWRHRRLAHEWHRFLGLSATPPQQPIRLADPSILHSQGLGFDVQSVTDQVTKITTAVLTSFFMNDVKTFLSDAIHAAIQEHFSAIKPPSSHPRYQTASQDCDAVQSLSCQALTKPDTPRIPLSNSSQQPSLLPDSYDVDHDVPDPCLYSPPRSQAGSLRGDSPPATDHPFTFSTTPPKRPFTPVMSTNRKGKAREVIDLTSPEIIPGSDFLEPSYDRLKGKPSTSKVQLKPLFNQGKILPSFPSPPLIGRKRSLSHVSEMQEGQDTPSRQKRRCKPPAEGHECHPISTSIFNPPNSSSRVSPPTQIQIARHDIISSKHTTGQLSPLRPSPGPTTRMNMEVIRTAIRNLMQNPNAREKSVAQMNALLAVVYAKTDLLVTMATGGGKSMLWLIPSCISKTSKSIVICPFVSLLEEQYRKTQAFGIPCHNYNESKAVPLSARVLFAQVENCASEEFAKFLASPCGKQFNRVFIDECHDAITGHPDRAGRWSSLASQFSSRQILIVLMSATVPPHLVRSFAEAFQINKDELTEIRSSTDRPEIGMHVVRIPPQAINSDAFNALIRLTDALSARLDQEERMLVFFSSHHEAETYAEKTGSAVYHSKLYARGNTRADNLQRWDQGDTSIMACTTAFAQGVDRSNVRFVVIFKPTFGLLTINQMLGRAGRDGKPSHVFFLTVGKVTTSSTNVKEAKDRCLKELEVLVNGNCCRRCINTQFMDGAALGKPCVESRGMECDICDPESEMQRLAMKAVRSPTFTPNTTLDLTHAPLAIPEPERPAFVPTSSLLNTAPNKTQLMALASKLTQGSDDLYGSCHITTSQEEALHAMERATLPLHPLHPKPIQTAVYKSSSQPSKDALSWASSRGHPPPSSFPSNPQSSILRADRNHGITQARLQRTARLNHYMQVLRGRCPLHFGWQDTLVLQEQHACYLDREIGFDKYSEFKHGFNFPPFSYCYKCGLPQDQKRNGEQPECHAGIRYGANTSCPFEGFIFKTIFCIWQRDTHRELLKHDLHAPDSWAAFVAWVGEEPGKGQYNNLLEAFLWFCGNLEALNPNLFEAERHS